VKPWLRQVLFNMKYFVVLLVLFIISACSSDGEERHEYMDGYSVKALEMPPKLKQIENRNELDIPQPSARAMQLLAARENVEGSIAPRFEGIKLASEQGVYWLEIQQSVEQVWPVLQDFLSHEGIKIERNEPMLGFIETEWVEEYQAKREGGFFSKIFSSLSPDVLDKFRIRIERGANSKLSKVFVSHRGKEVSAIEDERHWQQRVPEPVLEREILYRLALFAGLKKKYADEIFVDYKPYQERIRILDSETSSYEIVGNSSFVWNRIIHALDRLGADITSQNRKQGIIQLTLGKVPQELKVEQDELAQSSWLMNMFKGTGDSNGPVKVASLSMHVKASGNVTRMQLQHADGRHITTGLPAEFKDSLVKLLK